jgi:hypothetical protein
MKKQIIFTTLFSLALASNSYAFSFGDIFGTEKPAATSGLTVDSVVNAVSGNMANPVITLAANQLGIPAQYVPHIETLYNLYMNKGSLVAKDISSTKGLNSWVESTDKFSAASLASSLVSVFASQ